MSLTTKEYTALRIFLLKVINKSIESLTDAEVNAAKKVLKDFVNE